MTSFLIKDYYASIGSRFTKEDAEVIGPTLVELAEEGNATPEAVLDRAKSSNSPLHAYFEWDDKRAAHFYRIEQAKDIIKSVKVKFVSNGVERTGRATHVVKTSPAEDREQERSIRVLHGETAFAFQMLEKAIEDLRAFQKRYGPYEDMWTSFRDCLRDVLKQVDTATKKTDIEGAAEGVDFAFAGLVEWKAAYGDTLHGIANVPDTIEAVTKAIEKASKVFAKLEAKHKRKCISCEDDFISTGNGNRMCDTCRTKVFGNGHETHADA